MSKHDQPFFPESLDHQVGSQRELNAIMKAHSHLSASFVWTAVADRKRKEWFEDNWPRVRPYLDPDFLSIFQTDVESYAARSWEFYLAATFLNQDLPLVPSTGKLGPDFRLDFEGQTIWIEAVACTRGIGDDAVEPPPVMKPGVIYSSGGNIVELDRKPALRITSAIGSKLEKFRSYLAAGTVKPTDVLIIAVSGEHVQRISDPARLFKFAVFGQGPDVLVKVSGQEKLKGGYYQPIASLPRMSKPDDPVPTHFMEMDEFGIISAIIYSGSSVATHISHDKVSGEDLLFAYHTHATNPVPKNLFGFGTAIRKNRKTGQIAERPQNT